MIIIIYQKLAIKYLEKNINKKIENLDYTNLILNQQIENFLLFT